MKLHHKLMIVLALFGLLPTLVVGWLGRDAVRQLEVELSESGRDILRERTSERLTASMNQAAALVDHQRAVVELGVRLQAEAAEAALAAGGEADAIDDTFQTIRDTLPEAFLWQFIATSDGEYRSFPDRGLVRVGQDPRGRRWYEQAAVAGELVWATPVRDRLSDQLVLIAAAPVLDADGHLAGVTGIAVSVLDSISRLQDRAALPSITAAMLVVPVNDGIGDTPGGLRVIARSDAASVGEADDIWRLSAGGQDSDTAEAAALAELAADIREGASGVARLPYRGVDALWAYGALGTFDGALVFVVPFAHIEALSADISDTIAEASRQQLTATGGVVLVILVLAALGAWTAAHTVSGPLVGLRRAVDRVAAGDMDARAPVPPAGSRDELGALSQRFNAMVPLLQDRLVLRRALGLAQEVQQALLPDRPPALPGFDIAGTSLYCDETGGDYFDYIPLRRDAFGRPRRLAVLVGDVAGHGIASALMMTTTRALLRSHAEGADEPGALLAAVNPLLAADARGGRFMTAFALFLGAGQPLAAWSSAGHDPALVYHPARDDFATLDGEDIPLGIDPDWMFAPSEARMLEPGQVIVIGTDGIWEARDSTGAMFGKDRLKDIIRSHHAASAQDIVMAILRATAAHRGATPPRDDATVVVVKVT